MFDGPIFIVGRPRSGTKLLRELLNQHSSIAIPFCESQFIPHYISKATALGNLDDARNAWSLIETLSNTEFYHAITGPNGYPRIDKNLWLSSVSDFSYAGIVGTLFKLYASCEGKTIWGDKTPSYMLHLPLLKELYPQAKFIHIIRDVRDVCLSLMKTWGLHPLRGAQQWVDSIVKCRHDAQRFLAGDYFEITYESLIQNPKVELQQLCTFVDLTFEDGMTSPKKQVEVLGDTRGATDIVSSNMGKWRQRLSAGLIERIEAISIELLQELGYPVLYAKRQTRLSSLQCFLLKGMDAWKQFMFDCTHEGGFTKGVLYQYRKRRYG